MHNGPQTFTAKHFFSLTAERFAEPDYTDIANGYSDMPGLVQVYTGMVLVTSTKWVLNLWANSKFMHAVYANNEFPS